MAERSIFLRVGVKDQEAFRAALAAMGKDGESMLRRIEDAGKPASRSLAVVSATAAELKASLTAAGSSLGPLSAGLGALGGAAGTIGLGVAALGIAFVGLTKRALETADALGDTADALGISVKAYQQFSGAAQLAGVSAEQFEVGIRTLQDRLANAAAKGGEAAAPFRRLGVAFQTAAGEARNAEQVFPELAEAFSKVENAAESLALRQDLLGKAGSRFGALFSEGADGLSRFAREAEALGLTLDEKLVRQAGAANDKLDLMARVISINLTQAFLNVAPYVDKFSQFVLLLSSSRGLTEGLAGKASDIPSMLGFGGPNDPVAAMAKLNEQFNLAATKVQALEGILRDVDLGRLGKVDRDGLVAQLAAARREADGLARAMQSLDREDPLRNSGTFNRSVVWPPAQIGVKPPGALTKSELAKQAEEDAKALEKLKTAFAALQGEVNPVVKITQEYNERLETLKKSVLAFNIGAEEELRIRAEIEKSRADALRAADKEALALIKATEEQGKRNAGVEKYIVGLEGHAIAASRSAKEEKVLLATNEAQAKLVDELGRKTRDLTDAEMGRIRAAVEGREAFDQAQKEAEKFAQDQQRLIERSADRLVDVGSDLIFDALEARGEDYWQKFTAWGKRAFAQLLAEQLLRPIAINLISSALGTPQAAGQAGAGFNPLSIAQTAGQAKGGLDFLSNIPSMLKSIFSPDNFIANAFPSLFGAGTVGGLGAAASGSAAAVQAAGWGLTTTAGAGVGVAAGPLAAMAPFLPLLALTLPLILPGVANRACRVVPVASPTGGVERRRA